MYPIFPKRRHPGRLVAIVFILVLACVAAYNAYKAVFVPLATFPQPYTISLEKGESVTSLANELAANGALENITIFKILMRSLGGEAHLGVGEYYFDRPLSLFDLALRFSGKNFGITRTRVTVPEGFASSAIATRMSQTFHTFTAAQFQSLAKSHEGYLFPDTYLFFPTVTPQEIVQTMQSTFDQKTAELKARALLEGKDWNTIVIMASIIEKEAAGNQDRKIIAGILWKRIAAGIALQADATALYAPGNVAYNTYQHKGLPPTAIANPGLAAIDAALDPEPSAYLYYLHDPEGGVHYASTFKQHEANIQKYLR